MFGLNEQVGQKYFTNGENKLMVTSCFLTLQGEGPFAGRPAVFLRLSKCQLACGFCDTWFDSGTWMTLDQTWATIQETIKARFAGRNVPEWLDIGSGCANLLLVITGGEPMLQAALVPFIERVQNKFLTIQIESNGLQLQPIDDSVYLVVSPKCSEVKGVPFKYLQLPKRVLDRANCLKFVMCADRSNPYSKVPDWAFAWQAECNKPIYVSPMAEYLQQPSTAPLSKGDLEARSKAEKVSFWEEGLFDKIKMRANYEYAAQYCISHGCCLSLQQQIFCSLA